MTLPIANCLGDLPSWPLPFPVGGVGGSTTAGRFLADLPVPPSGTFEPWLINSLLVVSILGAIFWAWNQGKDAIGRKPDIDEELAALKKRVEDEMVTAEALEERLKGWASEIERKFERALHDEFKQLNGERSRSIGGLHEKLDKTTNELRNELGNRINVVDGLVRGLIGELKHFRIGGHHE